MRGVWTALITPFDSHGKIDLAAYQRLLDDQKDARVSGVVPCGTTGESPSLTLDEKKLLITTAIRALKGSGVKVCAGTGTNNTEETIAFSRWASEQGADGVLVVTPYYSKPSQKGLESHFLSVADAVGCELTLYNVPSRTGVSLSASTVCALAAHPKIRSIKEATGNVSFTNEILDSLAEAKRSMDIISGDDATYLPLLSVGAAGVISVASNLFPRAMVSIQSAMDRGDPAQALSIHRRFSPLFRDLFIETNPVPVKFALSLAGVCSAHVRPPLAELTSANARAVGAAFKRCGLEGEKKR